MEDINAFGDVGLAPEFADDSRALVDNVRERLRFAKQLRDRVRGSGINARSLSGYRMNPDAEKFELNFDAARSLPLYELRLDPRQKMDG